jgi:hypothetical protein
MSRNSSGLHPLDRLPSDGWPIVVISCTIAAQSPAFTYVHNGCGNTGCATTSPVPGAARRDSECSDFCAISVEKHFCSTDGHLRNL